MRPLFREGFRRRLVFAFVAVAGVSAGALAVGTYLLVGESRQEASTSSAVASARLGRVIVQREHDVADLEALVNASARSAGFDTLVIEGSRTILSSSAALDAKDISPEVRSRVHVSPDNEPETVVIDGIRYLVFGEPTRAPGQVVFFLFTQRQLMAEMKTLGGVLAALWVVVVTMSALAGDFVARRTLTPVREAARAARSLAEGLLETRLPVRTGDEFGMWANCFNDMADALEDKITELGRARDLERRFTADVAHELRTPLSSMLGAVSMLEEEVGQLSPEARRPAELVISGVRRLRTLVMELLELYSMDQEPPQVSTELLRMDECIRALVEACGWEGKVGMDLQPVTVETDRRRLERVATNLIGNAIEHGGGNVRVAVLRRDGDAMLEVTDEGQGIPPDELPNLFARFYKADPSRRKGGPGLGLAIAAENVRILGGRIEAMAAQPRGARFVVRLPAEAGELRDTGMGNPEPLGERGGSRGG